MKRTSDILPQWLNFTREQKLARVEQIRAEQKISITRVKKSRTRKGTKRVDKLKDMIEAMTPAEKEAFFAALENS